jgi:hypothetical protein
MAGEARHFVETPSPVLSHDMREPMLDGETCRVGQVCSSDGWRNRAFLDRAVAYSVRIRCRGHPTSNA